MRADVPGHCAAGHCAALRHMAEPGRESRYTLDNTPIDKRNTLMQINVWSATRKEANTLARAIESAITASPAFVATPEGEPASVHEEDTGLYGAIQRYSIWSAR